MMARPVFHGEQLRKERRKDAPSMAHVLIVTDDTDVCDVLDDNLREAGHEVLTAPTNDQARAVLRVSYHSLVVLIHSPHSLPDSLAFLRMERTDRAGNLARHRFIVLTARPHDMPPEERDLLARLHAKVLDLPFDLEDLRAAIERAEGELASQPTLAPAPRGSGPL
jgi:DNA-binding response OmpR family regulator